MPKASQIEPASNISILMKGPFGFGKTIAACSFATLGPVFLAYFDKKVPIEVFNFYSKFRPELLDRIEYESYSSANAHEYLNKLISFVNNGCPYVAVITDSVTSLTSAAVNWSLGFRDPKGGKKDKINKDAPQLIPDFDEYKVETSLTMQALDICKSLNAFNIWIAHPVPTLQVTGSGNTMTVSKVTNIVSYGQKVGAMIPGAFTEIYHFGREVDYSTSPSTVKRVVLTDMIGDDFAKTSYNLPKKFDITDKLFSEVWTDLVGRSLIEKVVNIDRGGKHEVPVTKVNSPTWVNPFTK